jgi:acyl carrier protein
VTQPADIRSRIQNEILDYVAREILRDERHRIDPEEALISSGLIDSFHLVDLALFVESAFDVRIDDTELSASVFDSVRELTEFILERLRGDAG